MAEEDAVSFTHDVLGSGTNPRPHHTTNSRGTSSYRYQEQGKGHLSVPCSVNSHEPLQSSGQKIVKTSSEHYIFDPHCLSFRKESRNIFGEMSPDKNSPQRESREDVEKLKIESLLWKIEGMRLSAVAEDLANRCRSMQACVEEATRTGGAGNAELKAELDRLLSVNQKNLEALKMKKLSLEKARKKIDALTAENTLLKMALETLGKGQSELVSLYKQTEEQAMFAKTLDSQVSRMKEYMQTAAEREEKLTQALQEIEKLKAQNAELMMSRSASSPSKMFNASFGKPHSPSPNKKLIPINSEPNLDLFREPQDAPLTKHLLEELKEMFNKPPKEASSYYECEMVRIKIDSVLRGVFSFSAREQGVPKEEIGSPTNTNNPSEGSPTIATLKKEVSNLVAAISGTLHNFLMNIPTQPSRVQSRNPSDHKLLRHIDSSEGLGSGGPSKRGSFSCLDPAEANILSPSKAKPSGSVKYSSALALNNSALQQQQITDLTGQNASLQSRVDSLESANHTLQQEVDSLQNKISFDRKKDEEFREKAEAVKKQLESELDRAEEEIRGLMTRNAELETNLIGKTKEAKVLVAEMMELKTVSAEKTAALGQMEAAFEELQHNLVRELTAAREELARRDQADKDGGKKKEFNQSDYELDEMRDFVMSMKRETGYESEGKEHARRKSRELEVEAERDRATSNKLLIERLEREKNTLERQKGSLERIIEELKDRNRTMMDQLVKAEQAQLNAASTIAHTKEREYLQDRNKSLEAEVSRLRKEVEESDRNLRELRGRIETNGRDPDLKERLVSSEREKNIAYAKLAELEEARVGQERTIERLKSQTERRSLRDNQAKQALPKLYQLKNLVASLTKELFAVRASHVDLMKMFSGRLNSLRGLFREEAEIAPKGTLNQIVKFKDSKREIQELKEEHKRHLREIDAEFTIKINSMKTHNSHIEQSFQAQVSNMVSEIQRLQSENESLTKKLAKLEESKSSESSTLQNLRTQLQSALTKLSVAEADCDEMKRAREEATELVTQLTIKLSEAEDKCQAAEEKFEALMKETKKKALFAGGKENMSGNTREESLSSRVKQMESAIVHLTTALEAKDKQLSKLKQQKQQVAGIEQQAQSPPDRVSVIRTKVELLFEKMRKSIAQLAQLETQVGHSQYPKSTAFKADLESLCNDYESIAKKFVNEAIEICQQSLKVFENLQAVNSKLKSKAT